MRVFEFTFAHMKLDEQGASSQVDCSSGVEDSPDLTCICPTAGGTIGDLQGGGIGDLSGQGDAAPQGVPM